MSTVLQDYVRADNLKVHSLPAMIFLPLCNDGQLHIQEQKTAGPRLRIPVMQLVKKSGDQFTIDGDMIDASVDNLHKARHRSRNKHSVDFRLFNSWNVPHGTGQDEYPAGGVSCCVRKTSLSSFGRAWEQTWF
jgi:hypothetical protein